MKITWLASYPRSGNTLLRTILFNCFGLKSASLYPQDLKGNKYLENIVGHIEHNKNNTISFPEDSLPLVKTHELNKDDKPSIYVIRDGRATCVSYFNYINRSLIEEGHYDKKISMRDIILGKHRFGKWCDHISSWDPLNRKNTLLIKYEDMVENFDIVLSSISNFLEKEILSNKLPSRDTLAKSDGKWVRKKSNWEEKISKEEIELFNEINCSALKAFNYE